MTEGGMYMTISPRGDSTWSLSSSLPNNISYSSPSVKMTVTPSSSPSSSQSPVWRLSRILRNSFSKLKPKRSYLHTKSKSTDVLKKHQDQCGDDDEEKENSLVVTPMEQEMVIASIQKGLPIIPFPMPNFVISNNDLEENRENTVRDTKVQPSGTTADLRTNIMTDTVGKTRQTCY